MQTPASTHWPNPGSPALARIVRSICARSKSFKKRVRHFDIGIETDSGTDPTHERLNLEFRSWRDNPDRLTIAFWDDGTMWLDARQSSKSGWEYEFSFYGNFNNVDPDVVRDMIERSMWIADQEQMCNVWTQCEPYTK